MNEHFWKLTLLILIPLIGGLIAFSSSKSARWIAFISSILTLAIISTIGCTISEGNALASSHQWITSLGSNFSLSLDGKNFVLVLLTSLIFSLIFLFKGANVDKSNSFYGLLMLSMTGLMGVFLANDLLLFYFFWELALIPVYFLASMWGGNKRIQVSFKFFVYTFVGSLIMLAGIIYLYLQNPDRNFEFASLLSIANGLSDYQQTFLFVMFFIAFAIKMPIFPLHSWQPDAYQQTLTPVTIVLSAVMVKMGIFALMKWLIPFFPMGMQEAQTIVLFLSVVSIIYGSLAAMVQTNIKRLIAFSSIAHIGLMVLAIFSNTDIGNQAAILQMFNHGINIAGMWMIIWILEEKYQTQDMREMGRLANVAPVLSIFLLIISFANIGLPLTNGFIGEFLLFHGIFQSAHPYHITFMVLAGLGIILGAIYTLNMIQKVAYIQNGTLESFKLSKSEWISLSIITLIIIVLGVYPNAIMQFIH